MWLDIKVLDGQIIFQAIDYHCFSILLIIPVTNDGKLYACGEATNSRLGLSTSQSNVPQPKQLIALRQYVIKKVAVHSGQFDNQII